jgi:hypothetical protein
MAKSISSIASLGRNLSRLILHVKNLNDKKMLTDEGLNCLIEILDIINPEIKMILLA